MLTAALLTFIKCSCPKLKNAGGFELLRCIAGSRDLEVIQYANSHSPRLLRARLGIAKVFIHPIQLDLDLSATPIDYTGNVNQHKQHKQHNYIAT